MPFVWDKSHTEDSNYSVSGSKQNNKVPHHHQDLFVPGAFDMPPPHGASSRVWGLMVSHSSVNVQQCEYSLLVIILFYCRGGWGFRMIVWWVGERDTESCTGWTRPGGCCCVGVYGVLIDFSVYRTCALLTISDKSLHNKSSDSRNFDV